MTQLISSDKNHPSEVRIKISAAAEISLLTLTIKRPESCALDEFHNVLSGVEFTNSYQDNVNSTSHFDAHFSGFWLIIDAF